MTPLSAASVCHDAFLLNRIEDFDPCRNRRKARRLGAHDRPPPGQGMGASARAFWTRIRRLTRTGIVRKRDETRGWRRTRRPPLLSRIGRLSSRIVMAGVTRPFSQPHGGVAGGRLAKVRSRQPFPISHVISIFCGRAVVFASVPTSKTAGRKS